MKRRSFLQSLAAAATLPALPFKALASAAPTAAALDQPYLWATFVSRVHNNCSPAKLQRLLKMDEGTAKAVYSELIKNNVITPPNAYGFSQAVNPYPQATMLNNAPKTVAKTVETQRVKPKLKAETEEKEDDSQSVNQEVTASQDDADDIPNDLPHSTEPERKA